MELTTAHRLQAPTLAAALLAASLLSPGVVLAQDASAVKPGPQGAPAAHATPAPTDLEPAVDTTKAEPRAPAPAPAAASAPRRAAPTAAATDAGAKTVSGATTPAGKGAKAGAPKGPDRLELDTTDITGNRELPKVLYIVPWKRSDLGDLVGKPVNSLLDEVLQPLDRDVFQRQNRYYDALKPGDAAAKAGAVQGSGDKP